MLQQNFSEKYFPKNINDLPLEPKFLEILKNHIKCDVTKLLLICDDHYTKSILVPAIIRELNLDENVDKLVIRDIKDKSILNMRYKLRIFCKSTFTNVKKLLIIDNIHTYTESLQLLFNSNIDMCNDNIHIIMTTNNIYNVDEGLSSRIFPLHVPNINTNQLMTIIDNVCKYEDIEINDECKQFIITISEKKVQSVYYILEKCKLIQYDTPVSVEIINKSCTLIHFDKLTTYIVLCKENKLNCAYEHLITIIDTGHSVIDILNELFLFIKTVETVSEEDKYKCCNIISLYIVIFTTLHEEELELLLFTFDIIDILKII